MRALALIYSHSPWVLENPSWIQSQTEKDSESQKESQNASVGRPMFMVDRAVDRILTESSLLSVGRPGSRPLLATVDRANPLHVMHTGRLVGRPAFSTD